jgi:hypothetical protein
MNDAPALADSSQNSPAQKTIPARWICAGLLAVHSILLAWSAAQNSATFDEPMHLAAGSAYWRWGDLSIYSLSPPLLRFWAAAPAVLAGAKVPDPKSSHDYEVAMRHLAYVDDFTDANKNNFEHLLFLSRLGMIPISCLTALLVYRWAKDLYGVISGLAACALYCFHPSILAHGSLVTTDVGTTTTMLLASWLWWRFCRRPTVGRWLLVCLGVLAAHLCKFTAVLIWPMMLAMAVPYVLRTRGRWKIYLLAWAAAIPMTILLINASYGFIDCFPRLGDFQFNSTFMQKIQQDLPAGFRIPFPTVMVEGFDAQKYDTSLGYPAFLFDEIYTGARWYYYPAALLCKTPVGLLALLLAAVLTLPIQRANIAPEDWASPWSMAMAGIVFITGVLIIGDVNIGTRYILPMLPFALIFTSRLWTLPWRPSSILSRVRDGLLLMTVVESVIAVPYFLSYINFAWGGPPAGLRLLSNSDYDWGQGLIALRAWMRDRGVDQVTLVYFGYIDPGVYGINYRIPQEIPQTNFVAISAFYVQGMGNRIVTAPHHRDGVNLTFFRQLQEKRPVAILADTIYVYDKTDVVTSVMEFRATH